MSLENKKLILVVGATGAQGLAIVDKLLENSSDGSPSPYAVRALTRDPAGLRAQSLAKKGVELFQGRFDDFPTMRKAFDGCYGAWVNTDGFSIGEKEEIYVSMRLFEIAKQTPSIRHYIYSALDYSTKKGNYDPIYRTEHYDGKGRAAEWISVQPSTVSDTDLSWTIVTSGPYLEMLRLPTIGPLNRRADGTVVFASPVGNGHIPLIALSDLGKFARYTLDHRVETSGKNLEVATELVKWDNLVETYTKVTGQPAIHKRLTIEEWFANFVNADAVPLANERKGAGESISWKQNFTAFWSMWRDGIVHRDMEWCRRTIPNLHTLESWMRETGYQADIEKVWTNADLLKNREDHGSFVVDKEAASRM